MEKLGLDPDTLAGRAPRPHLRPHQGLRPVRSVRRVPQLRHARPGRRRVVLAHRRPRRSADPSRRHVRRHGTGAHTAMAILAAYVQRQRTGEGQVIEMSMHEVMTMFIRTTGVGGVGRSTAPAAPRIGNALGGAPTDMYPCPPFGPNDYVFMMVGTPRMWEALCTVIDRPDLLDGRALHARGRPPASTRTCCTPRSPPGAARRRSTRRWRCSPEPASRRRR